MTRELIGLLQDLGGYVQVGLKKEVLTRLGKGVDYTDPKYKNMARRVIEFIHPPQMNLTLEKIISETDSTKTLRFTRTDGPLPPFRAGQYINLFLEIEGILTSRPYSISSAPGVDAMHLDLTVREKPDGFVSPYLLKKAETGTSFRSSGPAGSFYHEPLIDGRELVFLAGGSGVTPFMSIIREQEKKGWPLKIDLLYGCRTPEDVIFEKELKKLARGNENFNFMLVVSAPPAGYRGAKGFLDAKVIKKLTGAPEGKTFYVCGPKVMYDFCLPELKKLGVPRHKIRRELYGPPDNITQEPGWPEHITADRIFEVTVKGHKTVSARAGEPLMNSLEKWGLAIPALCRSGECSLCRTRLLSGKVFMPESAGLRESDRNNGYIHPCVTYPLDDLVIRI